MTTSPELDPPPADAAPADTPTPADTRLRLAGTQNVRDVGGLRAEGGRIRHRTLLRADALHQLDDAGRAVLADIGVRTVIDLREQIECDTAPDALDGLDVRYVHQPIFAERWDRRPRSLTDVYEMKIERCGANLTAAVRLLAQPGALPAIVHCTGGKDRTGLVVALTLSTLGVSDHDIAEEYALTSRHLDITKLHNVRTMQAAQRTDPALLPELAKSPPELMLHILDILHTNHGGAAAYLRTHGATDEDFAALRVGLVEPTDEKV